MSESKVKAKAQKQANYLMEWLRDHGFKVTGKFFVSKDKEVTIWSTDRKHLHNLFLIDERYQIYKWFGMQHGWEKMVDEKAIQGNNSVQYQQVQK
ncbi:hypothetical protein [Mycobacteroides abscessus]|uniref:hypothetical protein n=1 Tax=unclassified Desemzia TaxID=2685243 RepID=UPI0009D1A2CC|nr:Uncharacterised protein [Mycobacteroides abscessus subsp. abscessus]